MYNNKLSYEELEHYIKEFLKEHKSASLATCLNNIPRSSPVLYYMGKDLDIYILSAGGQKFKAIDENPTVCLLVNTEYIDHRKIKGVQVFGKATTSLKSKELIREALEYVPHPHLLEEDKLNVIKIVPEEIVYLNSIEKGERIKQILNIQDKIADAKEEEKLVLL